MRQNGIYCDNTNLEQKGTALEGGDYEGTLYIVYLCNVLRH